MSSIKKKFKWSRKGVSEIIGNILILGITVTLFSSIMVFVSSMPPPQENAYADFSTQPRWVHDMAITINVTHIGGQELKNSTTKIVLTLNGIQQVAYITDSSPSIGTTWVTGETWRYDLPLLIGENPYGTLNIMVIDTEKNNVVWTGTISGGTVGSGVKPIISARGTTPSPTYAGDLMYIFATVTDPDGDLNYSDVWIDLSSLGLASHIRMAASYGDSVFKTGPWTAELAWSGKTVIVNATDLNGHSETGLITLTIYPKAGGSTGGDQYGPFYNYSGYLINGTYPPDATGGEAGSSVGTTFYYIRRASDRAIIKDFDPGEQVLIEVYSNALSNLALENAFAIFHPITGEEIYPQSKDTNAFQYGGIYGTFNKYVYNFSAPGDPYAYPLTLKFKDSTGVSVSLIDTITVSGVTYPMIETYKLVGTDLVKTTNFNHTDTMYVRIITRDVDRNSNTVYLSDIEISDYTGRYIVKKVPPSYAEPPAYSAPISSLFKTSGTSTARIYEGTSNGVYTMYVVLKDAYQGWWLPNKNSYTIKMLQIRDTGSGGTTAEVYNLLNVQVNVTAPLSTTDLVATVGSGSFTWSASGASWSENQVAWYSGGEQWDETVIDDNPNSGCIGIAMADISGDGRNDVVIGSQDASYANLVWYENLKADGSQWSSARTISMPFDADPGTNASGGTGTGNANEDVSVYTTSGTDQFRPSYGGVSYTNIYELCGSVAVDDLDGDGDGDVVASFIHVVVTTSATDAGSASSSNSFGMYFNRGIYVFWNDGSWTKTVLYSTLDWIPGDAANKDTNPAAMDLAIGDFDRDGYPDVVAVYETGATKVWLNLWGKSSGDVITHERNAFGTAASLRNLPTTGTAASSSDNSLPWEHLQYIARVRVADMNLDQYPDVVRTTNKGKNVYVIYTQPGSPDEVIASATYEYPVSTTEGAVRVVGPPEQLTERYLNYTPFWVVPSQKGASDSTGELISKLQQNDTINYVVGTGTYNTLWTTYWTVDSAYSGLTVSNVRILAKYSTDAGYAGTGKLQWSFDGVTFYDTTIIPVNTGGSGTYVYAQITLPKSVDTYAELQSLDLKFVNNDGTRSVYFDFINMNVTFVHTRELGWVYQIPNSLRAYHTLTFTGHRSATSAETFRLAYSVDNVTWFNLTDITWTSDQTYTVNLTYTPSSWYWVRFEDNIRDTSDSINDTMYVTTMRIRHFALTVSWDASHTIKVTSSAASDYINAIAVGDIGKVGGDYKPDGLPDIVFTTARVGSGYDLQSLFIMTQDSLGTFNTRPCYTTQMAILCSNSAQYDTKAVELGDNDGDGDLDIVVVVGAPPGVTPGTGPTMWSYMNNQQYSTGAGAWQFGESYVNVLASKGESAINVKEGNIDLTVFLPFLGVLGVVAAEAVVNRKRKAK